mgnify:FL=1
MSTSRLPVFITLWFYNLNSQCYMVHVINIPNRLFTEYGMLSRYAQSYCRIVTDSKYMYMYISGLDITLFVLDDLLVLQN